MPLFTVFPLFGMFYTSSTGKAILALTYHSVLPYHCFPGSFLKCYVFSLPLTHITGPGGGVGILFTPLCPFQIILSHCSLKTTNLESLVIRLQPLSSFPYGSYVPSPPCCFLKILAACLHPVQYSYCDWASQHPQTQYINHCLPAYTPILENLPCPAPGWQSSMC